MEQAKIDFVKKMAVLAERGFHIWPEFAACEAALESGFGTSRLSIADFNLFGMKTHRHEVYGTVSLPTKEWSPKLHQFVTETANWVKYPDYDSCFKDRMSTLQRLSTAYPHYGNALKATDGVTFISEVSKTWSSDPQRGEKVLAIHKQVF